ncbi:MAG: nitronate monooxygenase [Sumerlaeia bacterium]
MNQAQNSSGGHLPSVIQGGMGVGVSGWRLASAVARKGMLGVVSGTALDQVMVRRLQQGDQDGAMRRACEAFPDPSVAECALRRYYVPGGKSPDQPFRSFPSHTIGMLAKFQAVSVLAAFAEVWCAKERHNGPVGINLLEKIALPNPAILYGAMLAGVDYVLMGAGIPWQVPGILDNLSTHRAVSQTVAVAGGRGEPPVDVPFDPKEVVQVPDAPLKRPSFLAIVSSATLAQALLKRATGAIQGFIVEHFTAGGHNAPPRGAAQNNDRGEPIYGPRDETDLEKMSALGLPFWLAGRQGYEGSVAQAQALGAAGVQVGTLFAFCSESGLDPDLRLQALASLQSGQADVFTDPLASPTGFPFKVVAVPGSLSDDEEYVGRRRLCDAGYLRALARRPDGRLVYRCPAEPVDAYAAKGGDPADTEGRKCLCNALIANIGLGQSRADGIVEKPMLTAGEDFLRLGTIMKDKLMNYTAADVLELLMRPAPVPA